MRQFQNFSFLEKLSIHYILLVMLLVLVEQKFIIMKLNLLILDKLRALLNRYNLLKNQLQH